MKEALVATLSETCTLTSREYVPKRGMATLNLSGTVRLLWWHSKN